MSTLELIVEDLKALPPSKLVEAAHYIHQLRQPSREDRLAALTQSAAVLSDEEGEELENIVEEGCERIDPRDW